MTNPNKTVITFVVDRSGSMHSIKSDAEGGINTFIEDQKKQPGEALIRISQFDNDYDTPVPTQDIRNVSKFTLIPRGSTALLDAIGRTVTELGEELSALDESDRPGKVIVVVVTDGYENASREWDAIRVRDLINEQRDKYSWDFVFLAANQDAIQTGDNYGFSAKSSLTYAATAAGATHSFAAASSYVTRSRSGINTSFTDAERKASLDSNTSV